MKTEREKITGKVAAAALRLAGEPYTLEPGEENCYLLLVYEGSVQLEYGSAGNAHQLHAGTLSKCQ